MTEERTAIQYTVKPVTIIGRERWEVHRRAGGHSWVIATYERKYAATEVALTLQRHAGDERE